MTAARSARAERRRLLTTQERLRRRWWHHASARDAAIARLEALWAQLAAVGADLDRLEAETAESGR
jgi:hypothetical protein